MRSRTLSYSLFVLLAAMSVLQGCGSIAQSMFPYLKEHQRLEAEGEDARAEIVSVTQTGWFMNNQPEVELELKIFPKGAEPYLGKTTLICPLMAIPRYQPGNTVPVKIDRSKQTVTVSGSVGQTPVAF